MKKSLIILSCLNEILLTPIMEACLEDSIDIEAVIIDGELPKKDQDIVKNRLGTHYKIKDIIDFNYPSIPFYFVNNHNSKEVLDLVEKMDSDYLINGGTPRIIEGDLLTIKKGIINCHPGILPKYRGCSCVEWAIYNNEPVGATAHFMTEKIDLGNIIMQEIMPVEAYQSYEDVRAKMVEFCAKLFAKAVIKCFEENLTFDKDQNYDEGQYFKPISKDKIKEIKEKMLKGLYTSTK